MENLTLQLSSPIMTEVERVSKEEGLSKTALAERAIRYYIFESRFADIHPQLLQKAIQQGIRTDEDVFRRLS